MHSSTSFFGFRVLLCTPLQDGTILTHIHNTAQQHRKVIQTAKQQCGVFFSHSLPLSLSPSLYLVNINNAPFPSMPP